MGVAICEMGVRVREWHSNLIGPADLQADEGRRYPPNILSDARERGLNPGSNSAAGCPRCPARPPMFRSLPLPARYGLRNDQCTIPTRSILMRKGRSGEHELIVDDQSSAFGLSVVWAATTGFVASVFR